MFFMND